MISGILLCRWLEIPIFGEPSLTAEEAEDIREGMIVSAVGEVTERQESDETVRYTLRRVLVTYHDRQIPFAKLIVSAEKQESVCPPGSILRVTGWIQPVEPAGNPGQFNAAAYYGCRKIWYRIRAEQCRILREGGGLQERLFRLRERMEAVLLTSMGEDQAGILSAMLLGDKTLLSDGIRQDFQVGGCLHLLVISGLHVSLLGMTVLRILLRLRIPQTPACVSAGILMCLYTLMTGASAAALRACIMFLVYLLARILRRSYDTLSSMALAALLILAAEPGYLFYAGFQLSFAAAFGVSAASGILRRQFPYPGKSRPVAGPEDPGPERKKKLRRFWQNQWETSVSWLAVQLCTLPLMCFYFFEIPVWSLPLNLLLVPWAQYILLLGMAGGMAGLLFPGFGKVLLFPVNGMLFLSDRILDTAGRIPFCTWICGQPALWQCAVFYLCLGFFLIRCRSTANGRFRHGGAVLAAVILLLWRMPEPFSFTMLDVGQGDCFVIRRHNTVFLSDGGSMNVGEVGKYRILPYLKSRRISRLEGVFISHSDYDHMSGIEELLVMIARRETSLSIRCLFMPAWMEDTEDGVRIARECAAAGTQVRYLVRDDRIRAGDLVIDVLHPFRAAEASVSGKAAAEQTQPRQDGPVTVTDGIPCGGMQSGNAGSLVLQITYGSFTALLTGDLEKEGERELLPYLSDTDCLKAGHHGSRWSTSEELLEKVRPEITLISAPETSLYGHPHPETLERLKKAGSLVLATKDCGAVSITESRGEIRVESFRPLSRM